MLTAEPNVPYTMTQVIVGADGGQVVGALTAGAGAVVVCVQDKTRANAASAALDLAGVEALQQLLGEVAAAMRAAPADPARIPPTAGGS